MCQSCEVLNINGVNCHEIGCPDAWKDYTRECKECGVVMSVVVILGQKIGSRYSVLRIFRPEDREQVFCSEDCYNFYFNI